MAINYRPQPNVEDAAIRRRRAMAEALMQQGQATTQAPPEWAGMRVTPQLSLGQALAGVGTQLVGAYQARQADKAESALEQQKRQSIARALQGLTTPAQPAQAPSMPSVRTMGMPESPSSQAPASAPAAPDPRREAALQAIQGLPLEVQQQIVAQMGLSALGPKSQGFTGTLKPGERAYVEGQEVASAPDKPTLTDDQREYEFARTQGFKGSFQDWVIAQKRAGAPSTNLTVNTEKGLYGTMADAAGKEYVNQYGQARKAPELLNRARRVQAALGPDSQAITGAGAEQLLALSKVAAQLGFSTGDAAADTEGLARDLAASTLDQIKSSGLGAGSGFSNADRDFLEKVVGGKITLEAQTLRRLATLNEKSAIATIEAWNAQARRLKPDQLEALGMSMIEMPGGAAPAGGGPRLIQNPDGSYTYRP